MTPSLPSSIPAWLKAAILIVGAGGLLLIALIAGGVLDPKPLGSLAQQITPGRLAAPPGGRIERLLFSDASPPLTARLTAALVAGEPDSAYGLVAGDESDHLVVAVSPVGYVAIRRESPDGREDILPWQTWPHVRRDKAANEIWLDLEPQNGATRVVVRINRELLWTGRIEPPAGQIGLYAESFGREATVDFQQFELFDREP